MSESAKTTPVAPGMGRPSSSSSWAAGARKALAFVTRDLQQELSYRLSAFLSVLGLLFQVTLFFFMSRMFEGAMLKPLERYGGNFFEFVVVGIAFFSVQNVGTHTFSGGIRQGQMMGTLEAMLMTPTDTGVIVFFSALWSYLRVSVNVVIIAVAAVFYGVKLGQTNLVAVLLMFAIGILAFSSIGILSASFILAFKRGDPVASLFTMGSFLLGGVWFPVEVLPQWLQHLSKLLPITHLLEGMRYAIRGKTLYELREPIAYLAGFAAVVLPLALVAFKLAIRQAKKEGSLAQY